MEVMVGRTPAVDHHHNHHDEANHARSRFGLLRDMDPSNDARNLGLGFGFGNRSRSGRSDALAEKSVSVSPPSPLSSSSSSSSSIGVQSDDDGDSEEVQSQNRSGLSSLDSLEDSLPIKRGLSNHFAGKSKSFSNLSAVGSVEDLKKEENPINKRRRTLMASKWARKASRQSFYGWSSHPTSMPLLALAEDDDDDVDDEYDEDENGPQTPQSLTGQNGNAGATARRMRSFKSPSCFCLTDLQEEDEEDE